MFLWRHFFLIQWTFKIYSLYVRQITLCNMSGLCPMNWRPYKQKQIPTPQKRNSVSKVQHKSLAKFWVFHCLPALQISDSWLQELLYSVNVFIYECIYYVKNSLRHKPLTLVRLTDDLSITEREGKHKP